MCLCVCVYRGKHSLGVCAPVYVLEECSACRRIHNDWKTTEGIFSRVFTEYSLEYFGDVTCSESFCETVSHFLKTLLSSNFVEEEPSHNAH